MLKKLYKMSLVQIVYAIYLHTLGFPIFCLLLLLGWKKQRISDNLSLMRLRPSLFFRPRFYRNVTLDLLRVLHGNYGRHIYSRPQDKPKMQALRSESALFLSAHFHNWELMGSWLIQSQTIPLLSVAVPLNQSRANGVLKYLRRKMGIRTLDRNIPRLALRHLRSGKSFGMLWDQYSPEGKIQTLFFDVSLRINPLPLFLFQNSLSPVFFGVLLPTGEFRLIQLFHPRKSYTDLFHAHPPHSIHALPLSSPLPLANRRRLSPDRLARRYHRVLEILVRAHPAFWYGLTHRRFRDQISY